MINQKLTMLDLFSGIGGFSYAAEQWGIETIGFSEIDPFCKKVLSNHWPNIKNHGDIKNLNFNNHVNIITGGFPCQPFSIAGKRGGRNDKRYLWGEFFRIIKQSRPCWVLIENVSGIISLGIDDVLFDLESEGYAAETFILPACAANAPHRRDRVWVVAYRFSERRWLCEHYWKRRQIQINKKWNAKEIQQKWKEFQPFSWSSYKAKDWLQFNARASGNNDGLSHRLDRIKALGNSIVPQIAFVLLGIIYHLELLN